MNDALAGQARDREQLVAEQLPAAAPPTVAPREPGIVVGMIGAWIFPGWVGPHLGASRWRTAILAAVLGSSGSLWLMSSASVSADYVRETMTFSRRVHIGPQYVIGRALTAMTATDAFLLFAVLLPGGCAACVLLLALPAIPLADVGESWGQLAGRCVRTACYLVSIGIPIGMLFVVLEQYEVFVDRSTTPYQYRLSYDIVWPLASVWAASVWLRALRGYAGSAEGPAWEPIRPLCASCGYTLTALRTDQQCPECNHPVPDSLAGRRVPTRWQCASGPVTRLLAFPATVRGVCFGRRFFDRLPTLTDGEAGKRFFFWNWVFASVAAFLSTLAVDRLLAAGRHEPVIRGTVMVVPAACILALMVLLAQVLVVGGAFGATRRHRARSRGARFYLAALVWLVIIGIHAIVLVAGGASERRGAPRLGVVVGHHVQWSDVIYLVAFGLFSTPWFRNYL